jgi:hypothetical protein
MFVIPALKLFIAFVPFVLFVVKQCFQNDAEVSLFFCKILHKRLTKENLHDILGAGEKA